MNERLTAQPAMNAPDILIIGGGIAGLSAASTLAAAPGSPSSKPRTPSATIRRAVARRCFIMRLATPWCGRLRLASRPFFDDPPVGFTAVPLGPRRAVLVHALEDELDALDKLSRRYCAVRQLDRLDDKGIRRALPGDPAPVSGARSQGCSIRKAFISIRMPCFRGNLRQLRRSGGEIGHGRAGPHDQSARKALGSHNRARRQFPGTRPSQCSGSLGRRYRETRRLESDWASLR